VCIPKLPIWVHFGGENDLPFGFENVFDFGYILGTFLVYFFPVLVVCCPKKNMATLEDSEKKLIKNGSWH
jgi:hypothetical protein